MARDTMLAYLHPQQVSASFHESLLELISWDVGHDRRLGPLGSQACNGYDLAHCRNQSVVQLLDSKMDWLLFVDADMGFRMDALDMLHQAADPKHRPIVGGLCFRYNPTEEDGLNGHRFQVMPTIYQYIQTPSGWRFLERNSYPVNALTKCDATGAAFLLIHRSVFERVQDEFGPHWFEERYDDTGQRLSSEDLSFFHRCLSLGIPTHVHTGVRTNHHKPRWVSDVDFWAEFQPEPADTEVDVIVPVLHRPQNVAPLLRSLRASTGLATAWFVCEPDDAEEAAEVEAHGGRVLVHPGSFAQKANYAYQHTTAPQLVLVGDDVRFRAGWLDHCQHFVRHYAAKVVGTNDLGNPRVMRGEHATHFLIVRDYIDEQGASWDGPGVVCSDYRHCFVDDEIVIAAKQRGVWQMALGAHIEHLHPYWGKAEQDAVYKKGQGHFDADQRRFLRRLREYANAA